MKTNLSNNFSELGNTIGEYLKLHLDLIKLSFLEKMTKISVFLISMIVLIVLGSIFFLFASAAFVIWYGNQFQDYLAGLLIVMGAIVVLAVIFLFIRRNLISSAIIRTINSILFENNKED
ncbi:phage holin family protein [Gaoshiqia sp. Z1-71]|uniref:phage holin family protein n=1 Tax=Gaoshiqia hydrogeniformans TaxID=3290090 RepID=UPI003BF8A98A